MNQKEVSELRRRFKPEKSAISRIYGCYVNSNREIIAEVDASLGTMPQEEAELYLGLLKKALSGGLGRNLIDIVFSTRQVADSEEHRLLTGLRDCGLRDGALRRALYEKLIAALDPEEGNHLILLAHDAYDVPRRAKDGTVDGSDTVFSYFVCCVCPVKDGKPELGYFAGDNEFHCSAPCQVVGQPELGFLFPAFDGRAANLYNALFYARRPEQLHQEVIDAVFRTDPPMSAAEQREAFEGALADALGEGCSMEVVQAVHEGLRERILRHKEEKDPEPLTVAPAEVGALLAGCGVGEDRVSAFLDRCGERFGRGAALSPANLIDSRRFEIKTAAGTLSVDPERTYLAETRAIDGRTYLLLPVEGEVEVNGFGVRASGN